MAMKNPGGEIVQVQGGHIVRSTGRKDRHSKVSTAKGPRDRRVRLSAHTAIQFYDVQDRLGYDRPSKAVDWLIKKAKSSIDKLAELPPWHPTNDTTPAQAEPEADPPVSLSSEMDPAPTFDGLSFFPSAASAEVTFNYPSENLGLSLHSFQAPPQPALFGFGYDPAAFNQRGTLQSSTTNFSQMVRAWDDLPSMATSSAQHHHHHQIHSHHNQHPPPSSSTSSIFGTRFVSDVSSGGGFPMFCIPARIHGEDDGEHQHGGVSERPSSSSSPNSTHC